MPRHIRLLPFAAADGATNMAADEALLETASERGIASLRFYTWSVPTLTLGYFQPSDFAGQVPNLAGVPWVRRSTGGAGIVHHHELTYSFALPAGKDWKVPDSRICRFHRLVQSLLSAQGVDSRLVVCGEEQKLGDVLCFLHQTPGDLVVRGSKVVGSAQRKLRGAMLQHGSVLLRRSEFAPELPGVSDLAGRDRFDAQGLAGLLGREFAADCDATIEPGDWTAGERDRVPQIQAEKYANPEWNGRR